MTWWILFALWQVVTDPRYGADLSAVWVPLAWATCPLLSVPFVGFLALSGKAIPISCAIFSASALCRRKWAFLWIALSVAVFPLVLSWEFAQRVSLRIETYRLVLKAILNHPIIGNGFDPLSEAVVLQASVPNALPSIHSGWLALAFHSGVPALFLTLLLVWRVIGGLSRGARASFLCAAILAFGEDLLSIRWMAADLLLIFLLSKKNERSVDA